MLRIYRTRLPGGPPQAQESAVVTPPPSGGGIPDNALVADDGQAIVTDSGDYIVVE